MAESITNDPWKTTDMMFVRPQPPHGLHCTLKGSIGFMVGRGMVMFGWLDGSEAVCETVCESRRSSSTRRRSARTAKRER